MVDSQATGEGGQVVDVQQQQRARPEDQRQVAVNKAKPTGVQLKKRIIVKEARQQSVRVERHCAEQNANNEQQRVAVST
ncbi:hypothetical protein TYRP_018689 [Tyrophagus putrescentiae]|nr:hypothetical protein TYRP_018689 [Tyrophagus putrescentiae]